MIVKSYSDENKYWIAYANDGEEIRLYQCADKYEQDGIVKEFEMYGVITLKCSPIKHSIWSTEHAERISPDTVSPMVMGERLRKMDVGIEYDDESY